MRPKILIAPDKFKGSLSAWEVCNALKTSFAESNDLLEVTICPMADGGDGSLDVLRANRDVLPLSCEVQGPLGRVHRAIYYSYGKTAFIELASASGLVLLKREDQDPMRTSTYGTGLQIVDAMERGLEEIVLFLGGSATNDGGMGIAHALGFRFLDDEGEKLRPIGASLSRVVRIVPPEGRTKFPKFVLCCDVDNPPFGPFGAAEIYSRQKGADDVAVKLLDEGMVNLCKRLEVYSGLDLKEMKGGGAAGGVAVCLSALLSARITSGVEYFSELTKLDHKISESDIVISGEGRLDHQSLRGKVVSEVLRLGMKHQKKLFLVVGSKTPDAEEVLSRSVDQIFAITDYSKDIHDGIIRARGYLNRIGKEIFTRITE